MEQVDATFTNGFLTELCGVEVTQHLVGTFTRHEAGGREISHFNFNSTLTAGDVTVESRAHGPEFLTENPDGSLTLVVVGVTMRNVPGIGTVGPFAGRSVTVIAPDGSEVLTHSAGLRGGDDVLCSVLRGA
ncbi:hypothetical protein GCM10009866_14200 [Cellulomonas aerilata]